jgi:hypothetical protein
VRSSCHWRCFTVLLRHQERADRLGVSAVWMDTRKKYADLRDASERIRNTSKETNRNRKCGGASSCRKCSSLYLPHWEAQGNPKLPALIVSQCLLYSHSVLVLREPEVSLPLPLWLSRRQCPDPGLFLRSGCFSSPFGRVCSSPCPG